MVPFYSERLNFTNAASSISQRYDIIIPQIWGVLVILLWRHTSLKNPWPTTLWLMCSADWLNVTMLGYFFMQEQVPHSVLADSCCQYMVWALVCYLAEWLPGGGRLRGRWLSFTSVRHEARRDSSAWDTITSLVNVTHGSYSIFTVYNQSRKEW